MRTTLTLEGKDWLLIQQAMERDLLRRGSEIRALKDNHQDAKPAIAESNRLQELIKTVDFGVVL